MQGGSLGVQGSIAMGTRSPGADGPCRDLQGLAAIESSNLVAPGFLTLAAHQIHLGEL